MTKRTRTRSKTTAASPAARLLGLPRFITIPGIIGLLTLAGLIFELPTKAKTSWSVFFGSDEARIAVADTVFAPNDEGEFPKIEVTVHNTGKKTAIIKGAEFRVEGVWKLKTRALAAIPLPPSATYDVVLPVEKVQVPYTVSVNISHVIKSDDADRFAFSIANNASPHGEEYIVIMRMILIYNKSNHETIEQTIAYLLRHRSLMEQRFEPSSYRDCIAYLNRGVIAVISQLYGSDSGVVMNQRLRDLLAVPPRAMCP